MSYLDNIFTKYIDKSKINTIFELGSRDLVDAFKLQNYYNSKVYAFECNPDCLIECEKNLSNATDKIKSNVILINKAISLRDGDLTFYPFDLNKYNNMGASSLLKIDFSLRNADDPDYNKENPQKEISVKGVRLDTFLLENNISNIDMLCIDLQGYELNAIKSLGDKLKNVKYIITECSIESTYTGGARFKELHEYLTSFNFKYCSSNKFGEIFPNLDLKGFSEFDALYIFCPGGDTGNN
jgi:FkbM family methyltransferase